MSDMLKEATNWLLVGETGASSKFIVRCIVTGNTAKELIDKARKQE